MVERQEEQEPLLTVKAAAAAASCHEDTIRRAYSVGGLAVLKIGRRGIRIRPAALAEWLEVGGKTTVVSQ
jgi:excisionase family DNA binding protein